MTQDFYILDEDKQYARERIAQLEQAILDLGPDFHEAVTQSSETWHDNAPFDALREKQSVLVAEMQQLKEVLQKASLTIPATTANKVDIGALVRLLGADDQTYEYVLAGHWTPRAGDSQDGAIIVSCSSPVGQALRGKKVGDVLQLGPKRTPVTIAAIR